LQKEPPRVGLILGAGGMKAFAHVGVLKEFARARIPIASVAGLEWGAAMAGIYALQAQANEVEWKSFRLRENELPSSSFFGGNAKAQPVAILRDFLDVAFGRAALERNRVDFGCPAFSPKSEKLLWLNRGSARDAVARCLAYPPFYVDAGGWIGSPFAIEEAAAYLRSRGANFVVFVNPLAQGELLPEKLQAEDYSDSVLWAEIRRHASRPQIAGVNVIIPVAAQGIRVTDFEARKQMMDLGAKAASEVVNKLVSKYGF
jgi:NTE family protein